MEERLFESDASMWKEVWEESKKMWRVTFPAILSRVSAYGVFVITQAFIGHISSTELAAYSLLQIFSVRFVNGILIGISSAIDTLCGQAFGAKQYHMLGIYLQQSWIINLVTATILVPLFVFTEPIFKLLGEEAEIAEAAGYIALWFIPVIYFLAFNLTIELFLQSQLKNRIVGILFTSLFAIHLFLLWIFVCILDWGLPGALSTLILSSWSVVIGEFIYVFGGWCQDSWRGFTCAAFVDLWPVIKLSMSSGVMLCLELWYNAVLVLAASYTTDGVDAIAAFSICLNVATWEFMICLGFFVGASVRVSNELGRGNAKTAQFSMKINMGTSVGIGVIFWILCLVLGRKMAYIFTSDEAVVEEVSNLIVPLAFTILLNSVQPVQSGVAVGSGRQAMAAWVNIISYYVIGIPSGILLTYVAHLGVTGIWIGMLIGRVTQTVWLGFMIWQTDWDEQVEKASERLNRWSLGKPEDVSDGPARGRLDIDSTDE